MLVVSNATRSAQSRLMNARRDALVLAILIAAVLLLIWNGSAFFSNLRIAGPSSDAEAASPAPH